MKPSFPPLLPDQRGFYGAYGGTYAPEILMPALAELAELFEQVVAQSSFWDEYVRELREFSGRPTPITLASNLSRHLGGARIFIKREDLGQTGAHKINNVIGQGMLARRLGKRRVIAETGAGQHGVATATMAARFGLEAVIYMGAEDVERQRPNVFWMQQLGARVVAVEDGSRTLKDAINEAMRDWANHFTTSHYVLGTACGPHPFPAIVSWLQSIIGAEARQQMHDWYGTKPKQVYACVGGGSNALGVFQGFLGDAGVELIGVEAGGKGMGPGEHASRIAGPKPAAVPGIAQGYRTLFLQNDDGQMLDTYSVAAGLDYVGVSPIIADLAARSVVRLERASDSETIEAARLLMRHEGIIPALESSHALAAGFRAAARLAPTDAILINLSGRGDKDIFTIAQAFGDESWGRFLQHKAAQIHGGGTN